MTSFKLNPNSINVVTPFYDAFDAAGKPNPLYCLSNFSKHPITDPHTGITYPTSEHFFQAQKILGNPRYSNAEQQRFLNELLKKENAEPRRALDLANLWTGKTPRRPGELVDIRPWDKTDVEQWEKIKEKVMSYALDLKLAQHKDVQTILEETGNTCLVEDTDTDLEWGWGATGTGKNRLGILWMDKRNRLYAKRHALDAKKQQDLMVNAQQLYQRVQAERIALGTKPHGSKGRLENYGIPVSSAKSSANGPANAPANGSFAAGGDGSSIFNSFFSGLSSAFTGSNTAGTGFADGLKKIGKAVFDVIKGFADGTFRIEPLDIEKALVDLFKSFCNFIVEAVKPMANAFGFEDSSKKPAHSKSSSQAAPKPEMRKPEMRKPEMNNMDDAYSPGDAKRKVEKTEIARGNNKGLGFSADSRAAGLGVDAHGRSDHGRSDHGRSNGIHVTQAPPARSTASRASSADAFDLAAMAAAASRDELYDNVDTVPAARRTRG